VESDSIRYTSGAVGWMRSDPSCSIRRRSWWGVIATILSSAVRCTMPHQLPEGIQVDRARRPRGRFGLHTLYGANSQVTSDENPFDYHLQGEMKWLNKK